MIFASLPSTPGRHELRLHCGRGRVFWQRGESLRPVLAVTAMVHGDEYEGFGAALKLWETIKRRKIHGSVLILPVCNPYAAAAATRCSPDAIDGQNLARVFPGEAEGTRTERLAHTIWNLVEPADRIVDLHSGGAGYDYLPLAGYYRARDKPLAACFPISNLWKVPPNPGVLSYELAQRGKRVVAHEYGGEARFDPAGEKAYREGILRVMHRLGMIGSAPAGSRPTRRRTFTVTKMQAADEPGWFFAKARLGQKIRRGQVLGRWIGEDLDEKVIRSRFTGTIIGLRTLPRVERGLDLILVGSNSDMSRP